MATIVPALQNLLVPVICGSSYRNIGVQILDAL